MIHLYGSWTTALGYGIGSAYSRISKVKFLVYSILSLCVNESVRSIHTSRPHGLPGKWWMYIAPPRKLHSQPHRSLIQRFHKAYTMVVAFESRQWDREFSGSCDVFDPIPARPLMEFSQLERSCVVQMDLNSVPAKQTCSLGWRPSFAA